MVKLGKSIHSSVPVDNKNPIKQILKIVPKTAVFQNRVTIIFIPFTTSKKF